MMGRLADFRYGMRQNPFTSLQSLAIIDEVEVAASGDLVAELTISEDEQFYLSVAGDNQLQIITSGRVGNPVFHITDLEISLDGTNFTPLGALAGDIVVNANGCHIANLISPIIGCQKIRCKVSTVTLDVNNKITLTAMVASVSC